MKKTVILISALMLSAPAFAKTTIIHVSRSSSPLASLTKLTALTSLAGGGSSSTSLPPFGESYSLTGPGFGKGSSKTFSKTLPKLGTLDVSFNNGGKGGTLTFSESISQ